MKRVNLFLMVPTVFALAACSGGSSSSGGTPTSNGADGGGTNNIGDASSAGADGGAGDDSGDQTDMPTEYDATLSSASEVPSVASTSTGTAKFLLQTDGVTLAYDITQSVPNATSVALHLAYPGETGAVIHQLNNVSGHMTGNVMLTADEASALTNGQIYLEVQSQAFPSGELRGALVTPGSEIFVANLTGGQVVPSVTTMSAGHASLILNGAKDTVRYHFATTANPTDVHVDKAIGSLNGPVAFPLANVAQTVDGTFMLAGGDADDLEAGHFYFNVITAAHGTGELRGQIMHEGETLATAGLSGANEVPPVNTTATGGAQFILSPDGTSMRYEVVVNGIIPTGADLDTGKPGQAATVLYPLTLNATGAAGTLMMTTNDVNALRMSNLAVNVKSASNTSGELRGQLTAR